MFSEEIILQLYDDSVINCHLVMYLCYNAVIISMDHLVYVMSLHPSLSLSNIRMLVCVCIIIGQWVDLYMNYLTDRLRIRIDLYVICLTTILDL